MGFVEILGTLLALALAFNIGANNAGVAMGVPLGAKLVSRRWAIAIAIFAGLAGALLWGPGVTEKIGQELIAPQVVGLEIHLLITVPLVGLAVILTANILKIPIPTTHAVIASVVGVAIAYRALNLAPVIEILIWWAAIPIVAVTASFLLYLPFVRRHPKRPANGTSKVLLILAGAWVSFAAGANNAANAAGLLTGAGIADAFTSTLAAAVAMSVGTLLLGTRVMQTVGQGITYFSMERAGVVGFVSGSLLVAASIYQIPVSLAEAVVCASFGVALARYGVRRTWQNQNVKRIAVAWTAGPSFAVGAAFLISRAVI